MAVVTESNQAIETHSSDVRTYIYVWLTLLVLTIVEIVISYLELKEIGAVLILVFTFSKAALVAAFFMHLLYEKRRIFLTLSVFIIPLLILIPMTIIDVILPLYF